MEGVNPSEMKKAAALLPSLDSSHGYLVLPALPYVDMKLGITGGAETLGRFGGPVAAIGSHFLQGPQSSRRQLRKSLSFLSSRPLLRFMPE